MIKKYDHKTIQCDLILFKGMGEIDRDTPYSALCDDPALGWSEATRGQLFIFESDGGHSSILEEPYVGNLAEQFDSLLKQT